MICQAIILCQQMIAKHQVAVNTLQQNIALYTHGMLRRPMKLINWCRKFFESSVNSHV